MNRKQAIEAIKQGTHVLDTEGFDATSTKQFLQDNFDYQCFGDERYYGIDEAIIFLNELELNGRPIIKLSDILSLSEFEESTKETAISEMREYDEKLLKDFCEGWKQSVDLTLNGYVKEFLQHRYPDKELEELLKQREELEKRINELKSK